MSSLVVEYSKTSRASCKGCQKVISEANLRIGKVSKSFTYDGEMTFWYHPKCFDEAIEDVSSIKGFDDLYPEHQESLQKRFDGGAAPSSSAAADDEDDDKKEDEDIEGLKIEYAKSSRSSCVQCGDKIEKGALRLGNIEKSFRYAGLYSQWHHIECAFKQTKFPIPSHNDIHGFNDITAQDQKLVKELIKKHPTTASSASSSAPSSSASSKKAATTAAADGDHDDDGDVEGLKIEYAKSNRSGCAHCSEKIEKGTLRLGNLTKSYSYKGMFAQWYHIQCAFKQTKYPIASHSDLHGFNDIQANDQKLVKDLIKKNPPSAAAMDEQATGGKGKGKKGEKRSREDEDDEDSAKKSKSNPVTGAIKGIFNRIAKTFTK